jgi:hypothetical protein
MANAPNTNFSPLPAGKYGKSTKKLTRRCHQVNECKSVLVAERVLAMGALRNLQSTKNLAAEKREETNF